LFEETFVESIEDTFLAQGDFLAWVFLDGIECDSAQGGEVLCGLPGASAALAFSKRDIERPICSSSWPNNTSTKSSA
jgi:hypothetical protein